MSGVIRGHRLYVNVSAAEARRRLRGRGLGVKRVHSGGRNQAVVIHTAEGEHLRDLEGLFADVGSARMEAHLDEPIQNLRNLGPASSEWLRSVGIRTIADLRATGAVAAYLAVRDQDPTHSLNLLWALAAGLEGKDWRELTAAEKDDLRRECESA